MHYLLAIESSASIGGAALFGNHTLLHEEIAPEGLRHGTALFPAIERCLQSAGITPQDLSAIAVSVGPGSYTGIRIGVMAAKAMAYAIGCPLYPVSSLAALAWTAWAEITTSEKDGAKEENSFSNSPEMMIIPAQDARRDEIYAALYRFQGGKWESVVSDTALTPEEVVTLISQTPGRRICVGSALKRYPELSELPQRMGPSLELYTLDSPLPRSGGFLSFSLPPSALMDPFTLQPTYLRRDGAPAAFLRTPS